MLVQGGSHKLPKAAVGDDCSKDGREVAEHNEGVVQGGGSVLLVGEEADQVQRQHSWDGREEEWQTRWDGRRSGRQDGREEEEWQTRWDGRRSGRQDGMGGGVADKMGGRRSGRQDAYIATLQWRLASVSPAPTLPTSQSIV